ncbi:Uncharacterised protein [Mycoplasmoides gallisepticum]|uniref:Uncharacterized protein n=1 Tax=Mycoplasmoides gallisepticum TaxID=2096 RepID=A0A3B0PT46_MYCGL|nr:Uncharacterised protein [Mycoplasmoides gallisepticum]
MIDIGHHVESIFIDHIGELLVEKFHDQLEPKQLILGHSQFKIIKR